MSSADDIESGEKKPLLKKVDAKERKEIEELEDVGAANASFSNTLQLSVRGAFMMMLMASIIWVSDINKPFPNEIAARMALVACLFAFTVNPILGNAIANGFCGVLGTFWACFHMWVMNGIYPGGMKEGMSPTSAAAIFGWVNFFVFLWIFLWCRCGIGMKMFALANDIGFMLAFIDPKSTLVFSENFTFNYKGTAVNVLLATAIACVLAPLMNLLPYPMTFAFVDMKNKALKASKDTAKLFEAIVAYYERTEASVVIENELKKSVALRAELDGMGGSIGAAYWEGLDMGVRGTVRALMESHLGLLNEVYDRLRAIIIAVSTEDFGPSHNKIMEGISSSASLVAQSTTALLMAVTEAASDGDISSKEKDDLQKLIAASKSAVKQLAMDFDKTRRAFKPISSDTMGESFFVVTLSAYARLVWEYADMLISNPPKGSGCGAAMSGSISATWADLFERFNLNFAIKHFIAIVFCMFYSVYVDNFGGGCVITAVFLMSPNVCPDIQAFLNVLNAVIVGVIVGALVFQSTCYSGYGYILLPLASFIIWTGSFYGWFSGSALALPSLLIVALTPFKFVANCPKGDIAAGARALWGGMVANVLAILFVASFQYFMAPDKASNLSISSMDDAFTNMRKAFSAFWKAENAAEPMGPVAGSLGAGAGYNGGAKIEPRFWRAGWKGAYYDEVVGQVKQLRLDVLMLWYAMAGSNGQPKNIFDKFNKLQAFHEVESDLNTTIEDAHALVIDVLSYEGGTFSGLSKLKTTTGIDELDALPALIAGVNMAFPTKVGDSLEDDEICQVSSVFLLLDFTIKHIAVVLKSSIRNS